ncbi:MAG: HD domain-containing protein [Lachnospiraceae bacterium]|nr:HD domain-containing protein [Lachnospiraceae bacterium]
MSNFNHAIQFAVDAHSGYTRKGTGSPYIVHPMEVAAIVSTMTLDDDILAAAALHDVVEDAQVSIETIRNFFGPRVAELVASESEDKRPDLPKSETWKIRKEETINHLKATKDMAVKMITLGDKLSNLRATYQSYLKIGDAVWNQFNMKDKQLHGWYYKEILDAVSELSDYSVWEEYRWYVETLFGD